MRVVTDLTELERGRPAIVTIGAYDGVHRGHQFLIRQVVDRARRLDYDAVVITFQPRPEVILRPGAVQLTNAAAKTRIIGALGPDVLVVLPFNDETRNTRAGQFLVTVLDHINLAEIWIGADFAFGHKREGNVDFLIRSGQQSHFAVHILPRQPLGRVPISSSMIRELVAEGKVDEAAKYLGHFYGFSGPVVAGHGRGAPMGFPTANIQPPAYQQLPATGIYAAYARLFRGSSQAKEPAESYQIPAAASVGYNPHFHDQELSVEAFLLDWEGDLRGREIGVEFVQRVRGERDFESDAALIAEMHRDVACVRGMLARAKEPGELILSDIPGS